jgi:hypothetical protein
LIDTENPERCKKELRILILALFGGIIIFALSIFDGVWISIFLTGIIVIMFSIEVMIKVLDYLNLTQGCPVTIMGGIAKD